MCEHWQVGLSTSAQFLSQGLDLLCQVTEENPCGVSVGSGLGWGAKQPRPTTPQSLTCLFPRISEMQRNLSELVS